MHIFTYLLQDTCTQEIILNDPIKSLETNADADFSGSWDSSTSAHDISTAKSCSGYIILLAGSPIIWTSCL